MSGNVDRNIRATPKIWIFIFLYVAAFIFTFLLYGVAVLITVTAVLILGGIPAIYLYQRGVYKQLYMSGVAYDAVIVDIIKVDLYPKNKFLRLFHKGPKDLVRVIYEYHAENENMSREGSVDGNSISMKKIIGNENYRVGDKIKIFYASKLPEVSRIDSQFYRNLYFLK